MKEYIELEEEKAQKHRKVFNWETAKYGKIWYDEDIHDLRSVDTEFSAITFNDEVSSEKHFLMNQRDARMSKSDLSTELILSPQHIDEFDLNGETSLLDYDEKEQNVLNFNNLFPFNVIHLDDLKSEKDNDDNEINIPLTPRKQRHPFLRYQGLEYTDADIADFKERRFAVGRKSGAHISGGQFVARLAEHFGLSTTEILGGLTVISSELLINYMGELVRLQICEQLGDTWAWVAMGPERQPDATVDGPKTVKDAPADDKGGQADPVPIKAPQQPPPPPPAPTRTMPQRMARLEEDVHEVHEALAEQRKRRVRRRTGEANTSKA
uniref:Uncharacterized protein n=1 Tax=Tanacetum cinerariifolium TaxID=118510 RepID=A0A699GQ19_TANCI|nr:hypothetical protein [Tanacetum cinerariifolium]